jgi:hypothetical protein
LQPTLLLAKYQAGANEADSGQRTLQRGGRPVRREHADDPGADANECEDAVTRRSAAQVTLEPQRVSERGGN